MKNDTKRKSTKLDNIIIALLIVCSVVAYIFESLRIG